jgi:hypothetical protein
MKASAWKEVWPLETSSHVAPGHQNRAPVHSALDDVSAHQRFLGWIRLVLPCKFRLLGITKFLGLRTEGMITAGLFHLWTRRHSEARFWLFGLARSTSSWQYKS